MIQKVRISRETVRRNPNAGQTSYQYASGPVTSRRTEVNTKVFEGPPQCEVLISDETTVSSSLSQAIQTIHTLTPAPAWLFEFEPTIIQCEYCNETFPYTELDDEYGEEFYYRNICPQCSSANCCEIEYERLQDVLKELGHVKDSIG